LPRSDVSRLCLRLNPEYDVTFKEVPLTNNAEDNFSHHHNPLDPDTIIINDVQLLLAEKRTSLAALRTGIAVFALPLSVLSILIATSRYYDIMHVMPLLLPLLLLSAALVILGTYLVMRAIIRIRHFTRLITAIKKKHSRIREFID
jgi:uncharacterized membrane protein YidH (DUF202 family)